MQIPHNIVEYITIRDDSVFELLESKGFLLAPQNNKNKKLVKFLYNLSEKYENSIYPICSVSIDILNDTMSINVIGIRETCTFLLNTLKDRYVYSGSSFNVNVPVTSYGAIESRIKTIVQKDITISKLNYPYLNADPADIIKTYLSSNESVILLYGEPGTGKTSFIRKMISFTDKSICMINDPDVISSPKLVSYLGSLDNTLIVIEDADNLLGKRTDGNAFMKGLLNLTDGVIKSTCKFVFSTNLTDINDVDDALLRPGRCYGYYYFRKLTRVQANDLREYFGMSRVDYESPYVTIADALNTVRTADKPIQNKVGFI
jgi:hypothetical protein